jgi:hypothetical protein
VDLCNRNGQARRRTGARATPLPRHRWAARA